MLVSNIGLAFNVHYCGGKIASVSSVFSTEKVCKMEVVKVEKACCAKKIVVEHKKCCKDKVVHFKAKSDQDTAKAFSFAFPTSFLFTEWNPIVFQKKSIFKTTAVTDYYCDANAPPLFQLYSQYIFYA